MFGNSLQKYMILIPAVLIALMFHELAHGLVAYWLGDDTAKRAGRLTLNPLDHLDPLGTLCMIFFGFGWAKPVPVNTSRFRHRKVGMALTALAGPLANFLLSFVLIFAALLMQSLAPTNQILLALSRFFIQTGQLSVCLGVFNLIPIPPVSYTHLPGPGIFRDRNGVRGRRRPAECQCGRRVHPGQGEPCLLYTSRCV